MNKGRMWKQTEGAPKQNKPLVLVLGNERNEPYGLRNPNVSSCTEATDGIESENGEQLGKGFHGPTTFPLSRA